MPELPQWTAAERSLVLRLLRQHAPDHRATVFGSRARGTARRHSDLDLLLLGPRPLSSREYGNLLEALDESDLPYRVDVIDGQTADPGFLRLIQPQLLELN